MSSTATLLTVLTATLLVSMGCATEVKNSDAPDWQKKAMSRETGKLASTPITIDESGLTTVIAGELNNEVEPFEGGWHVSIDADSETTIECFVYSDDADPANLAKNLSLNVMDRHATETGATVERQLHYLTAGNFEHIPYIALEWLFTSSTAKETVLGMIKVRVTSVDNYGIGCLNADVGFRKTFSQVFESFVVNFKTNSNRDPSYYEEMFNIYIGEQSVGFIQDRYTLDSDRDTVITSRQSILVPTTNKDLSASDEWSVSYSRPDGSLINQYVYAVDDDELTKELSLRRDEENQWVVEGLFEGKDYTTEIPPSDKLMSQLGELQLIRLMTSTPDALTESTSTWAASLDPSRFLDINFSTTVATSDPRNVSATLGPLSLRFITDNNGTATSVLYETDQFTMKADRIWQSGGF